MKSMRDVPPKTVLMFAGGGVAHTSGGVGTLIGYLLDTWRADPAAPTVRVIDTRGDGGVAGAAISFLRALGVLLWGCANARWSLVHAHMTTRGSVIRKCLLCGLANLCGVPTIIHQHGADFHDYFRRQPLPVRRLIRRTLNNSSGVIVLGDAWRDFLTHEVGVRYGKVTMIANGVPKPQVMPNRRGSAADSPNILFLGRLGDRKGVPELLAALGSEDVRSRPWRAILAGDGEVDRFRAIAAAAGLADRVEVLGWQDRTTTNARLQEADIMVLPSHHEAMPVAILEALAHGVAVIATPVGVIPEFLKDGAEALLVPPGDVGRLGGALIRLLDEPQTRWELGEAGHRVFLATLDIRAVAERLLALYREAGVMAAPTPQVIEKLQEAAR